MALEDAGQLIRDIVDFPEPGIRFKDITPVLSSGPALAAVIESMAAPFVGQVDVVAGIEARGFILGAPAAVRLGVGFVPIRKPNKLPFTKVSQPYELEYGRDSVEVHVDAFQPGQRVLLVDDVLATGGTAGAAIELVQRCGALLVGASFLVELSFLDGRSRLEQLRAHSVFSFE